MKGGKSTKVLARILGLWASAIIVTCILTSCTNLQTVDTTTPDTTPPRVVSQEIAGQWQVLNSTARFKISFVDEHVRIEGWDSADGERFLISNVEWDGKRLRGTFTMASTGHTTYSDLLLIDINTLKGAYSGDNSSGEEVWKRQ